MNREQFTAKYIEGYLGNGYSQTRDADTITLQLPNDLRWAISSLMEKAYNHLTTIDPEMEDVRLLEQWPELYTLALTFGDVNPFVSDQLMYQKNLRISPAMLKVNDRRRSAIADYMIDECRCAEEELKRYPLTRAALDERADIAEIEAEEAQVAWR
jgi:hypothetical protein